MDQRASSRFLIQFFQTSKEKKPFKIGLPIIEVVATFFFVVTLMRYFFICKKIIYGISLVFSSEMHFLEQRKRLVT